MSDEIGTRFAAAVAAQDPAGVGECFAPDVEFRALTPPGLRERRGATEVAALFARWFGDSSDLHLLDSHCDEVGDRLHISYRCAGFENGEPYVVEHHLFCIVSGSKIRRADLLCSGFRPPIVTSV
jgi:ketosteroid isomerase-like protein